MAKHRVNGEGSIYKSADGRWRAAVHDVDRKRRYVSGKPYLGLLALALGMRQGEGSACRGPTSIRMPGRCASRRRSSV